MVSLQLSEELLEKFDKIQNNLGYKSRSEALRDAITSFMDDKEDRMQKTGLVRSLITIIYSNDMDIQDNIIEIERVYSDMIKTFIEYKINRQVFRIYLVVAEAPRTNDFIAAFNRINGTTSKIMEL